MKPGIVSIITSRNTPPLPSTLDQRRAGRLEPRHHRQNRIRREKCQGQRRVLHAAGQTREELDPVAQAKELEAAANCIRDQQLLLSTKQSGMRFGLGEDWKARGLGSMNGKGPEL